MDLVTPALVGVATGLTVASLALATFWLTLGTRIGKAEAAAADALQTAAEAAEAANKAQTSQTLLSANFSLYREQSIEKFVTHAAISEIERRLVEANTRSEERIGEQIGGMNRRLDRLIEAGLGRVETK